MAGAIVLEFGVGLDFGNLGFPDLIKYLEEHLERVKTLPDLERLIKELNPMLKNDKYSFEERHELKKLRQRAYDRRRNPKFQTSKKRLKQNPTSDLQSPSSPLSPNTNQDAKPLVLVQKPAECPKESSQKPIDTKRSPLAFEKEHEMSQMLSSVATNKPPAKPSSSHSFLAGVKRALASIDGELFARRLPHVLLFSTSIVLVAWFVWMQSIDLYQSAGFSSPRLSAAGGLIMVIGFAAYHSISRSKLALLLCLYAGGYEAYFMVSGTLQNEDQAFKINIDNNPELVFLREKSEISHSTYENFKKRYDDPTSEVHGNEWFKKKHIDPAWELNEKDQKAFLEKKNMLEQQDNSQHITWLKVFYRLGLVFLCMTLVHGICREKDTCFSG